MYILQPPQYLVQKITYVVVTNGLQNGRILVSQKALRAFPSRSANSQMYEFLLVSSVIYRDRFPSNTEQYTHLSFAPLWVLLIYPLYLLSAMRIIVNNEVCEAERKRLSVRFTQRSTYIFVLKPRKNFYFS